MRTVRDIQILHNIPVLVRAALNVPIENGEVKSTYRLEQALPTIHFLAERGARVILISHIGERGTETLKPVARALQNLIPRVSFFPETVGPHVRGAVRAMLPGEILVLENLRRNPGEKMNDHAFADELAALADIFVEDSFDTCHRAHASIVSVPKLIPAYAGLQLADEVRELAKALTPAHPSLAVIGGAKFNTKEAVLTKLLTTYDHVFVGGALANDFLKSTGYEVGKSFVSASGVADIATLLANKGLVLPIDTLVIPERAVGTPQARTHARVVSIDQVRPDEIMLDHGPATSALLSQLAGDAKSVLWNGPLGNYENGFVDATDAFAQAVAASGAHSVVGGGDTIASIQNLNLMSHFSFVSTGGGAMLDFLAEGSLPGIRVLG